MNSGMGRNISFYTPVITLINKTLIGLAVSFFILESIFSKLIERNLFFDYLALSSTGFFSGFFYQLITYSFVGESFFSLIFGSLIIWFIGSDLERSLGVKRYLGLLIGSLIFTGLTYLFLSLIMTRAAGFPPFFGLTTLSYALLICYAIIYSDRVLQFMLIFPMKAKYFCFLLIAIELYMGIFSSQGIISLAHLSSMFFSYLYLVFLTQGQLIDKVKNFITKRRDQKRKAHLTLVKKEEGGFEGHDFPKDVKNDEKGYWH